MAYCLNSRPASTILPIALGQARITSQSAFCAAYYSLLRKGLDGWVRISRASGQSIWMALWQLGAPYRQAGVDFASA